MMFASLAAAATSACRWPSHLPRRDSGRGLRHQRGGGRDGAGGADAFPGGRDRADPAPSLGQVPRCGQRSHIGDAFACGRCGHRYSRRSASQPDVSRDAPVHDRSLALHGRWAMSYSPQHGLPRDHAEDARARGRVRPQYSRRLLSGTRCRGTRAARAGGTASDRLRLRRACGSVCDPALQSDRQIDTAAQSARSGVDQDLRQRSGATSSSPPPISSS